MRASFGVCDDSLRALRAKVETLLESYVSPGKRDEARSGILSRPTQFSVACLGAPSSLVLKGSQSSVIQVMQLLGSGQTSRARTLLDSLQRPRRLLRPGEFSLDFTLAESWMRAAMGDSAGAARQLDLTLTALPTLSAYIVYEPGMAASVGRSMVFRAELAARRGDAGTAALWASRVLTLWAHSDPSLAPTMARMKALAAHRS